MLRVSGMVLVTESLAALIRMVCAPVGRLGWLIFDPPPPQPVRNPVKASASRARQISAWIPRAPLRMRHSRKSEAGSISRSVMPLNQGMAAAVVAGAVAVIVSDVEAVPPAVMDGFAGVKLQVIPTGRPEQVKVTFPERPESEPTFAVTAEEVEP